MPEAWRETSPWRAGVEHTEASRLTIGNRCLRVQHHYDACCSHGNQTSLVLGFLFAEHVLSYRLNVTSNNTWQPRTWQRIKPFWLIMKSRVQGIQVHNWSREKHKAFKDRGVFALSPHVYQQGLGCLYEDKRSCQSRSFEIYTSKRCSNRSGNRSCGCIR